jgi:hypothetical protein
MGGEVPSGLMGKPDQEQRFIPIEIGEWGRRYGTVYVLREIWQKLSPYTQEFTFYVQGKGRCRLYFDQPIGRLGI